MNLVCAFDPTQYRSPDRVWDIEKRQYTDQWKTRSDFEVIYCDGSREVVPKDFVYDKGSVPRILWPLFPRDDRAGVIAWQLHDYHYTVKNRPRSQVDKIMREILLISGMKPWRAWMVYRGVRAAVWKNWTL